MIRDGQGHAATFAGAEAALAWDHALDGFLKYRADLPLRLEAALALDPEAPLPVAMAGGFGLLAYNRRHLPAAQAALARARALRPNAREALHIAALQAWADGGQHRAIAIWEGLLAEYPRDLLAFRLHHFAAFWTGQPQAMWAQAERAIAHWSPEIPGYGSMLACRAFANEEAGHLLVAENCGREAIRRDPADLWATHAVAHVLEMQGRRAEGIGWIKGLARHFDGANNLRHHVFWHQALFHLERGEHEEVLRLYDEGFRDHGSPVTAAQPDLYIDCQNAIAMLFRLERQGVDAGTRWDELADIAEARIGDTLSAFTLPHWAMALAATGRLAAGRRLLDAVEQAGAGEGEAARILREAALPACRAALLRGEHRHAEAVAALLPALGGLHELGGSHAQQDVLEQLFLDCALRAGDGKAVRLILERVAGRWPTPPERRAGWREAAAAYPL